MRYATWQQYATRCEVMVSAFNGWDSKQKRAKNKKKKRKNKRGVNLLEQRAGWTGQWSC